MFEVNECFQNKERLEQRLIELGKMNGEILIYPLEDHACKEASS